LAGEVDLFLEGVLLLTEWEEAYATHSRKASATSETGADFLMKQRVVTKEELVVIMVEGEWAVVEEDKL